MIVFIVTIFFCASLGFVNTASSICGSNEVYVACRQKCPPQACNISYTEYNCDPLLDDPVLENSSECEPGCNCIDTYLRDANNVCIRNDDCPPPPPVCGENEVPSDCKQQCPPQTCDYDPTTTACKPGPCQPGCNCIEGYLRTSEGVCVERGVCPEAPPKCGENEVPSDCKQQCPPQTCDYDPTTTACKPGPCQPGCNCIEGYLRNSNGVCVLKETCPKALPECGENETPSVCKKVCPPQTCSFNPSKVACRPGPCRVGCNCNEGYLRNSKGKCILKELCPNKKAFQPDNDYENDFERSSSYSYASASASASSYSSSFSSAQSYNTDDDPVKIQEPETVTGTSNNCRANETYVRCNAGCPTNYCPVNDGLGIIACDPPYPCPSGCACSPNYKRISLDDDRCILASECPPVPCTRPHEIWYRCPPPCFSDSCRARGVEVDCYRSGPNCQPQCGCEEGYYRNDKGECVVEDDCETE